METDTATTAVDVGAPPSGDRITNTQTNDNFKIDLNKDQENPENGSAKTDKNGVPMSFDNPAFTEEQSPSDKNGKGDEKVDEKGKKKEKLEMVSLGQLVIWYYT